MSRHKLVCPASTWLTEIAKRTIIVLQKPQVVLAFTSLLLLHRSKWVQGYIFLWVLYAIISSMSCFECISFPFGIINGIKIYWFLCVELSLVNTPEHKPIGPGSSVSVHTSARRYNLYVDRSDRHILEWHPSVLTISTRLYVNIPVVRCWGSFPKDKKT